MGKSKDLATGASYVDTAGDTMTGRLSIQESAAAGEGILLINGHNVAGTYSDLKWAYSVADQSYGSGLRFKQVDTTHGGQLEFYTDNASGTYTKQMQITENGHVTTPYQPCFKANRNGSSFTVAASTKITQNRAIFDVGGNFSTSDSRFTAPIAGKYMFMFHIIYRGNYSNAWVEYRVNGSIQSANGQRHHFSADEGSVWHSIYMNHIFDLSANDYVEVWNGSTSVTYHGDDWGSWQGYLLG